MIADIREHRLIEGNPRHRAGTGKPESAIRESSPAVFSTTVFPPAFAPEITIVV